MTLTPDLTPELLLEQTRSREERYKLGQFFTPEPIARFMGDAILENSPTTVLDPAVGGGVLLRALGPEPRRYGLDIDEHAVAASTDGLADIGGTFQMSAGDFLDPLAWPLPESEFDAIVANPPYIRHHNLDAKHKALAAHYSRLLNVTVSSLSGSYVYFFLEAILRLRIGGRLVFITPTEFLDARYGAAVKQALLNTCEIDELLVLHQDDLAFDGVLTTSAITIATKAAKPSGSVRLTEGVMTADGIQRGDSVDLARDILSADLPWTPLLPTRAARLLPLLEGRRGRLGEYARFRRGIATGENAFFCLTQSEVDEHQIEREYLVPVVLGSKDLPLTGSLTEAHWRTGLEQGKKAWLLWCHTPEGGLQGTKVLDYIKLGEARGLQDRFNCRVRKPWYGVEQVEPPDFFVTYMSRDSARFVRNLAGARCMTSLLNVWAKAPVTADDIEPALHDPINAVLLREFGRTYGGGLGKIEPGDLAGLPVPVMDVRTRDGDHQLPLSLVAD